MTDRGTATEAAPTELIPARQRRPRRTSAQSREKILRAATAEFAKHGFAGARINRIVKQARSNPRMIYHYFGSKSGLYVAVLEAALGGLRAEELRLRLDVGHLDPLEGLLQLFDFMNAHFEGSRHLVNLLRGENMLKARFMRKSARIREISSPVVAMIEKFLERGIASGQFPEGLDGLRLYVLMVALSQFHLSNCHTLSIIFDRDLSDAAWRRARAAEARRMLASFLKRPVGASR
ncbi:MAG: TetR/AcrR family transcriptional regulator [Xanthobacteraceae bacterium]